MENEVAQINKKNIEKFMGKRDEKAFHRRGRLDCPEECEKMLCLINHWEMPSKITMKYYFIPTKWPRTKISDNMEVLFTVGSRVQHCQEQGSLADEVGDALLTPSSSSSMSRKVRIRHPTVMNLIQRVKANIQKWNGIELKISTVHWR